jgi:sulfite reductase (NADPH) flavoprotein alpha-component
MAASAVAPPLDLAQTQKVQSALDGLTPAQLQWVSGYVAGLAARNEAAPSAVARTATDSSNTMTILYGSQTGNGGQYQTRNTHQSGRQHARRGRPAG